MKRLLFPCSVFAFLGVVGCAPSPQGVGCDGQDTTLTRLQSMLRGGVTLCEQLPADNAYSFALRCNGSGCFHSRRSKPIARVCIGESCYQMPQRHGDHVRVYCDRECLAFRERSGQPVGLACEGACQRSRSSIMKTVAYVPARAVFAMVREAKDVIGF
jgi:hypothetical protein